MAKIKYKSCGVCVGRVRGPGPNLQSLPKKVYKKLFKADKKKVLLHYST